MKLSIELVGKSPLLMHNIQLANPDNHWAKSIAALTKKRTKTEDDRREIGRLEWLGSLYVDRGTIVIPTANVLKSFIETAKITREGKSVVRAAAMTGLSVPLIYNGAQKPEDLWKNQEFRDQTLVGVGKQRVLRTRPIFMAWMLRVEAEFLESVMDFESFAKIVKLAGRVEGLGDNRVNGYGRFEAQIEVVEADEELPAAAQKSQPAPAAPSKKKAA